MTVKPEHLIERQGKVFVLYIGLLNEAQEQGLKRMTTNLIQIPSEENGNVAICQAEAETSKGVFCGIGDASLTNVGQMVKGAIIRMSETRAKARALRDATNIGITAFEELDADEHTAEKKPEPRAEAAPVPKPAPAPDKRKDGPGDVDSVVNDYATKINDCHTLADLDKVTMEIKSITLTAHQHDALEMVFRAKNTALKAQAAKAAPRS